MRTQKRDYPNILIVEGADDKHSVIGLMKAHISWPRNEKAWPVYVELGNSVDEILADGYLTAEIKSSNAKAIGVMLDADSHVAGRYQRIRQLCAKLMPDLPIELPEGGLVVEFDEKRFGVWLMPDNKSPGDLETFLKLLVPDPQSRLWQMACNGVSEAVSAGAACRECHYPKANLYTWLAWQDPPGQSPGLAVTKRILDPRSESASAFVTWFKKLYQL